MIARARVLLPVVLLAALAALAAIDAAQAARRFADLDYAGSSDADDPRRLDLTAPAVPGPHPVLLLAGVDADEGLVGGMVARDHLVAEVRVRADHAHEDLLRAIQFMRRRASSYGGDPLRQVLVAGPALADAALRVAADPGRLAADGVPPSALRGVVVDAWPGADVMPVPRPANRHPAVLLVAGPGAEQRLASVVLAERWRAEGAAVEVVQRTAAVPGALQDRVLAWLPGAMLPRLARFETLRFEPAPQVAPVVAPPAAFAWAASRGALWQVRVEERLRVLRQDAPGAAWTRVLDAGDCRPVWFGVARAPDVPWLIADCEGRLRTWMLDRAAGFGAARDLGPAPGGIERAWAVALPGGDAILLVADAGDTSHILRVDPVGPARAEALPAGVRLSGAVAAGGAVYVAGFGAEGGRLLRRIAGPTPVWTTAAAWSAARGALRAPTTLPAEGDVVLGLLDAGEVVRIDPRRGEVVAETDLRDAFGSRWGDVPVRVRAACDAFVALRQPQGGDHVHAVGLDLERAADGARGWYVLRQSPGRFAYGRVGGRDGSKGSDVVGFVQSPFVGDAGAVVYAAPGDATTPLWRGTLPGEPVPQGLWRDVDQPGHGIALFRVDPGWMLLRWWTDGDGGRHWASATGEIERAQWVSPTPLLRYRKVPGDTRLQADDAGMLSLRFGVDAADPACAGRAVADAAALAVLRFGEAPPSCLALPSAAAAARPANDGSGVWSAVDGRFGLALWSTGAGADGTEQVLVFDFGADGSTRWAYANGARRDGAAALNLEDPAQRRVLAYRFSGDCARVEGSASLADEAAGGVPVGLVRIAGGACY